MKKSLLRILSAFLCIMMLVMMIPANAHAAQEREYIATVSKREINPLYQGLVAESNLSRSENQHTVLASNITCYASVEEAGTHMRECMKARHSVITLGLTSIEYSDEVIDQLNQRVLDQAFLHTGVPTEGDTIRWQWWEYIYNVRISYDGYLYYYEFEYNFTYYTTAQQEAELNAAINNLLRSMNVYHQSDYVKICTIYDYICDTVVYDYANLYVENYKLKFTPYAALFHRTAVCQGYALLFYRLALELGVDARFIGGYGAGENHGWNIVKLGNVYYNLDSTWDAGANQYSYFMRAPRNFPNHDRWEEYDSASFHRAYPMSATDFVHNSHSWIPANCVSPKTCSICGATEGLALGHKEVIDAGRAATCTATGLTEGKHCSVCNLVLVPQRTIEKLPHSFTDDKDESCNRCGYIRDTTPITDTVPVYRLYNPYTLEHLFTGGEAEKNALAAAGWVFEGIAWYAPKSGIPVHRLYNPNTDGHFYSISDSEVSNCIAAGWKYDGVVSYAVTADTVGATPVFRLFNPYETKNYHHYTADVSERDYLASLGWIFEGIAWYALSK